MREPASLERRRGFGVLRAIIARDGAIRALTRVEGLTLVVPAWAATAQT